MSLPLVKYVLKAAIRDRLVLSLLVILLVGSSLATFLGSSVITEKDQFTAVFAGGGLRIVSIFGLALFVVFFVRRSFESKDIEYLLSRPLSRLSILYSYAFAFSLLAILIELAVGLTVFSVAPHLFGYGHILWVVSIMVEAIIMVNVALFFSMYISSSANACMATFAVYVLGRLMGQLLGISDSTLVDSTGLYSMALQLVSIITPRLDLLGQTSWLIYGADGVYGLDDILIQGGVFSALVLLAASYDFIKRQF
ncbi:MAG: hypothetical protein ACTHOO_09460 [Alcanivorax sp.]